MPNTPNPFKQTVFGITYVRSTDPKPHTKESGYMSCTGCAVASHNTDPTLTPAKREALFETCLRLECMTETLSFIFTKEGS